MILTPIIKAIKNLALKATNLFFSALNTLLNIRGETSFRVRIANSRGGGLLQLNDAEVDALSLLDTAEQKRRLEDAGLLSDDEMGTVITLCLGINLNFFGAQIHMRSIKRA